jgi:CubicO group peptidase (beta-lactamase class C family)
MDRPLGGPTDGRSMTGSASVTSILAAVDGWGASRAAAAVVCGDGAVARHGDPHDRFPFASITKLVTAYAVLVAAEAGRVDLDGPAGPPGSTVRHLLAHASGLGVEGPAPISRPARTRIYSNAGYDLLGSLLADDAGVPFGEVLRRDVLDPLAMTGTKLVGRPSQGMHGTLDDLVAFARECLRPRVISTAMLTAATAAASPALAGVMPGLGRYDPLEWGLGFEIRGSKSPHWTGSRTSDRTFGHFGGAGTFIWVDPVADVALVCLTNREFGPWALDAWTALSDTVIDAVVRP